MTARADILDQRESLGKPFLASVLFHAVVFGSLAAYGLISTTGKFLWGDPHSLGGSGSVTITPVSQIPLPGRSGIRNPVANDTESRVPQPPAEAKPKKQARREDPDAISLKGRRRAKRLAEMAASQQRFRANPNERRNQLYSSTGQAMTSAMFGSSPGSGGVGVGIGTPFGDRYGYYVLLLRQRVSEKWNTGDVDPRLQTAPPVVVSFEIQHDGSVRSVKFLQRSGTSALDFSAQRAILDASPFPALPAGYTGSSATIEFWFELKR